MGSWCVVIWHAGWCGVVEDRLSWEQADCLLAELQWEDAGLRGAVVSAAAVREMGALVA